MKPVVNVRNLQPGEKYWPAYGGQYTDQNAKVWFLSNPEAATIASLYNLKAVDIQFEFFCFAYLWRYKELLLGSTKEYVLAAARFKKLQEKFRVPWYLQAKHVLPFESDSMYPFTEDGDLDLKEAKQVFSQYADYDFVLYRAALYDDPSWARINTELSVLVQPPLENTTRDPAVRTTS